MTTHRAPIAFDAQASTYDHERRILIPPYDAFYGTAVEALDLARRPIRDVLDLGAGTGLLAARVAAAHPDAALTLVDGAPR
ncbi:MAG TPA: methyltransferase, partial [Miltoncostaea sp.]|nr:methyltransferase [Miltoncostaea sp.]